VNVTTHKGAEGRTVDLCANHGQRDTLRRFLGADYFGVSHGLHAGECAECERRAAEPEALPDAPPVNDSPRART